MELQLFQKISLSRPILGLFSTFIKIFGQFLIVEDELFTLYLNSFFFLFSHCFCLKSQALLEIFDCVDKNKLIANVSKVYGRGVLTSHRNVPSSPRASPHPLQEKQKIETIKTMCKHAYLLSIFFHFQVTVAVGISYDVSSYV